MVQVNKETMVLSPVYILLGEENFLKENALLKITNKCFPHENDASVSFNYLSLDGKTATSSQVTSECQQLPFLGDTRLIVIKDADKIIDDTLIEYIKNPLKTTCLILLIRKIDKRLGIYKILGKYGEILEFDFPNENEIAEWIQKQVKLNKKNISSGDASLLSGILNNNLTGIKHELDKIITYVGEKDTITFNDIASIISENRITDSFALTESIQNKDKFSAISLVNKLLDQGNAIQQIIGTIRWMLTRLWMGKELIENGDRHDLSRELRIPNYFLNKFIQQAGRFTFEELKSGLITIFQLEKTIRTYKIPQNLALELLVIQLTQKTSE